MFIQTEATPNPNSMKFIPGKEVNPGEPVGFKTVREATNSPLAQNLFMIPQVKSIFLGSDFITITKVEDADWQLITPDILTTIMDHYLSGQDVIKLDVAKAASNNDDSDVVKQIKEIIETHVRPAVAQDGGDIIFDDFQDGIVYLELRGACSGCPSSVITLKSGIENMLKHYVPEVIAVEAINV